MRHALPLKPPKEPSEVRGNLASEHRRSVVSRDIEGASRGYLPSECILIGTFRLIIEGLQTCMVLHGENPFGEPSRLWQIKIFKYYILIPTRSMRLIVIRFFFYVHP